MKYSLVKGILHIDGKPDIKTGTYLCGTPYEIANTFVTQKEVDKANVVHNNEFPLTISPFQYNGFIGKIIKGKSPYNAAFKEWTSDPGVCKCICSDGKERLIPTFAMDIPFILPKQTYERGKVLFGVPSNSK